MDVTLDFGTEFNSKDDFTSQVRLFKERHGRKPTGEEMFGMM